MSKNITLEIGNSIDPANSISVEMDNQPKRLRDIELGGSVVVGPQGPAGPVGPKGEQGVSIVKIEKTAVNGNVDTYTITFSDGKTTTYEVKNGEVTLEELEQAVLNERIESEKRYAKAVDTEVITVEEFAQVELDEDGYMEDVSLKASKEITQKVREGYNQFKNPFNDVITINGVTLTPEDDKIHLEGELSANSSIRVDTKIPQSLLGKTITFKIFGLEKTKLVNGGFKNKVTGNDVLIVSPNSNSITAEITQDMIDKADIFDFYASIDRFTTINQDLYIQIIEGTEDKPYEAYGVSPSLNYPSEFQNVLKEVDFSNNQKNFFSANSSNVTFGSGGNATLERKINNNSLEIKCNGSWSRISCTIKGLKPNNKYTISCITKTDLSCRRGIYINDNYQDKAFTTSNDTRVVFKATTDSQGMINFYFYNNWSNESLNGTIIYDEIQITPGEVVAPYEQYQGNTSKLALPDGQFLGNFKGYSNAIDKGVLKGQLKELILTGDENIYNSSNGNIFRISLDTPHLENTSTNVKTDLVKSNYFNNVSYSELNNASVENGIEIYNNYIQFRDSQISSVEEWKSKLKELYDAGTPVKILYVAKTEEQQELSQENLQVVNSLQTYQGENNVSVPEAKLSFKANQGIPSYVAKVVDKKLVENNLSEREISDNKYARALKKEVSETDFTQIFAENEKIEGLQIYGEELTQEVREGYNLLNTLAAKKVGYTQTINGITFTILADGGILINGTATGTATDFYIRGSWDYETPLFTLDKGKTYTLKISDTNIGCLLALVKTKSSPFNTGSKGTLTLDNDLGITGVFVRVNNGTTLNNVTVYPLLYEGTEDKPYEQYGAMPSLDYPSEVQTMNDRVNLFDKDNVVEGGLSEDGNVLANSHWRVSDYIEVSPLTDYMFSWVSDSAYFQITVAMYNSDKTFLSKNNYSMSNSYAKTFQTISECKYLRIAYSVNVSGTNVTREKIKLAKGTQTSPYSPHGQGSLEVENVNENFAKVNYNSTTKAGVTITNNGNGSLSFNGTSTGSFNDYITDKFVLPAGDYILFANKTHPTSNLFGNFSLLDVSNNSIIKTMNFNYSYVNFTLKEEKTCKIQYYVPNGITLSNFIIYPMVLRGKDLKPFVPHQSQATLIPFPQDTFTGAIGSYKDTIKEVDGRWKVEKKLEEYAMTGTENLTLSGNTTDTILVPTFVLPKTGINNLLKSTHFKQNGSVVINSGNIYNNGRNIRFCLDKNIYPDINSFKAKLTELYNAGTPVEIYYALATPEYIDLPDETQEILNGIKLRLGLNNFSIDVGTFSYIYNKSLAKELEEKDALIEELASRILALENATLNLAEGE